ncbi:MAG: hydroxyethylthiazole kinase [Clostridium argentinense]|uniref:Hydroxyethylthiazole kinase n=1 Tax=Clostridium faecium TaxID=2762223 RepID=A0ABR8YMT0_9CLOT|nr:MULTISPECIES: hydroxyethylthiazole kinase [Clostridium]MBD8045554.1 hydroxyethylthiazole kinase [Clostridium faecium]MBS5825270.1 hydroxyethylthiazole kinase [Clostridium argentinense]MDU1350335.1 hydroxyethylthiazole kinase [Clostridium argentinense]
MDKYKSIEEFKIGSYILEEVKDKKPLIHEITNYVSCNDCANITLALGASPIMSEALEEVEEIVSKSSSLLINIGTLRKDTLKSMILAGKKANSLNIPVILDPVGVGASNFRKSSVENLLKEIKFSVIKGNFSEIKTLCGFESNSKGVDSEENEDGDSYINEGKTLAEALSYKFNSVICITGKRDIVCYKNICYIVENGHSIMSRVTAMGCALGAVIATLAAVTKEYLISTLTAVTLIGICGELAEQYIRKDLEGTGTFKMKFLDQVYNFSKEKLHENQRIYKV